MAKMLEQQQDYVTAELGLAPADIAIITHVAKPFENAVRMFRKFLACQKDNDPSGALGRFLKVI